MLRLFVVFLLCLPASAITLIENGRSSYSIALAAEASPSEQHAASELRRFLREMSGAELPIVTAAGVPLKGNLILLGDSSALRDVDHNLRPAAFGAEGFVLRTSGPHLIIAGGRQRGTLYGVYTFLDKLGCRWFTPEVSRIPKRPTIRIDALAETHKPAFEYREPFFTEAWDRDWAARNRTNGDHTRLDDTVGGKLKYYPFVHSFYELLPPDKYFADHPEYYSLIDGKRRHERGQLCLTSAAVLRIAIERVEQWIKEHPDVTIFSVSQNDWEGWCECDRCRRVEQEEGGQHSGPILRFVNAVAEDIGRRHPGKLIDTLAYWYTENPPAKARPAPNVRIRLCPIGICTSHSFAKCPRSAYFYKNLQAWSKITNQLYIWHYNTNFAHYQLPFPDFEELAADIPIYKRQGVVGLFMQGAYPTGGGGEQSELRAYVLARQLWDASTDVNRTVDEFLEGVYGTAAAKPIREYYDLLHQQMRPPDRHLSIFQVPDYSPGFRRQAVALFDKAEAAAPDEATRRRVRKARLPIEYYNLIRDSRYTVRDGFYTPTNIEGLVARARDLYSRMRTFGIQSIHEGVDLKVDEERLSQIQPLRAVTLRNDGWLVSIVPALNARAVRLTAKGKDLLRGFIPGERGYPALGGVVATAHPDYHARAWEVQWEIESDTATTATLTGKAANGATLRRTFALTADGLRTVTSVTNTTSNPLPVAIQARAEFGVDNIDRVQLHGRTLYDPEDEPNQTEAWLGPDLPASPWRLSSGGAISFDRPQVSRGFANWSAKAIPGATLGVWSPERTLAAGESLSIAVSIQR
ncbi:MAG: DUF4838 domain-containing protein [Bryobacterales bacterium]|nr:DUF4838 domain-containing protein [Bryobacterales bacterium]